MNDLLPDIWRPTLEVPSYFASWNGKVVSSASGTELKPSGDRYFQVLLYPGGGQKRLSRKVHSLVAEAFLGPRPAHLVVRHLNGNNKDNRLENLVYGTHAENAQDRIDHGHNERLLLIECVNGHEYTKENTYWRPLRNGRPGRGCIICRQKQSKDRRA